MIHAEGLRHKVFFLLLMTKGWSYGAVLSWPLVDEAYPSGCALTARPPMSPVGDIQE
jgi:hypothetical protein